MKRIAQNIAIIALGILAALVIVHAQGKPPADKYTPTELQSLRLQNAQLKAINAQQAMQAACGNGISPGSLNVAFSSSLAALTQEAEKVKKEQGWAEDTQFDQGTLVFSAPAPSAKAKPDPAKK